MGCMSLQYLRGLAGAIMVITLAAWGTSLSFDKTPHTLIIAPATSQTAVANMPAETLAATSSATSTIPN